MSNETLEEIIVAQNDAVFDALFYESALVAAFLSASDYGRFSDKNRRLTHALEAIVSRLYPSDLAEDHIGVGYDWWPDHTRFVECDVHCFNQQFFEARALLAGEYDEWRVQIMVYDDVMDGTTPIGAVVVWARQLLVDRKLWDWMSGQGFDFGVVAPRFVENAGLKRGDTLLDDMD